MSAITGIGDSTTIVFSATGAPPPIGTPPTNICRFEATPEGYLGRVAAPLPDVEAFAGEAGYVVIEAEEEEHCDEGDADDARSLHQLQRHRLAAEFLDQAPEDMAPVERQDRQEVDQPKREADDRKEQQRRIEPDVDHLVHDVADADDP